MNDPDLSYDSFCGLMCTDSARDRLLDAFLPDAKLFGVCVFHSEQIMKPRMMMIIADNIQHVYSMGLLHCIFQSFLVHRKKNSLTNDLDIYYLGIRRSIF